MSHAAAKVGKKVPFSHVSCLPSSIDTCLPQRYFLRRFGFQYVGDFIDPALFEHLHIRECKQARDTSNVTNVYIRVRKQCYDSAILNTIRRWNALRSKNHEDVIELIPSGERLITLFYCGRRTVHPLWTAVRTISDPELCRHWSHASGMQKTQRRASSDPLEVKVCMCTV
jgi:hypothetical protein